MAKIIIITTYQENLGKSGGLFDKVFIEAVGQLKKGYRLKDTLVFGYPCLKRQAGLSSNEKKEHIKSIVTDVFDWLYSSETHKNPIVNEVFFFAHGFDIDHGDENLKAINQEDNYNNFSNLILDTIKSTDWWKNRSIKDKPSVYLTAFSHSQNSLNSLIEEKKLIFEEHNSSIEEQFTHFGHMLHDEWYIEQQWFNNQDNLINKKFDNIPFSLYVQAYTVEFLYYYNSEITLEKPKKFYLEKLQNLIWNTSDKSNNPKNIIKVFFLPFSAITANNSKKFYLDLYNNILLKADTPVLFIGLKDIIHSEVQDLPLAIDPCYRFLDSSIWCRYASVVNLENDLESIFETFHWAYKNNLYNKNVCKEFIEFQGRLLSNSYLNDKFGSGHSLKVRPFTFHAENLMHLKSIEIRNWIAANNKNLKWNILLVDDYADYCLREAHDVEPESITGYNKGDIIRELISSGVNSSDSAYNIINIFDTINSPKEAASIIGCNAHREFSKIIDFDKFDSNNTVVYDVILLDYLFSFPENNQAFGTDLLDYIKQSTEYYGIGLMQSYWIYPITVFNEAIQSKLQEEGWQYLDEKWHLARGADPLNTPHLFLATLYDFMQSQAEFLLFEEEELWEFLVKHPLSKSKTLNRELYVQAYRQFIERFSVDEGTPETSALGKAASIFLQNNKLKPLRDHIRQLLYLLGFSIGFDFPVIEREFNAIQEIFYNSNMTFRKIDRIQIETSIANIANNIYSIKGKYF
jgi:hypothetical protein